MFTLNPHGLNKSRDHQTNAPHEQVSVLSFEFSNLRTVGATLLLIGCEELVFVATFVNKFRFLVKKGNIASS